MAVSVFSFFLLATLLLLFLPTSLSSPLLSSITKDPKTLQYTTTLYQRTPLKPIKLTVHLSSPFIWVDCERHYSSRSYTPVPCNSSLCESLDNKICTNCFKTPKPGCSLDTCNLYPSNPFTGSTTSAEALTDTLAVNTTDGRNPGPFSILPKFVFSCAPTKYRVKLAKGATGIAGLGRYNYSLPAQVSTDHSVPNAFAFCLSGSPSAPGVAFYGTSGPYFFLPEINLANSLIYTPLIFNPSSDSQFTYWLPSWSYYIGVTSINVNGKSVPLNKTLLAIDPESGKGGTKLSTVVPYTTLETSIYKAFTEAFTREAASLNVTLVKPVTPFTTCFTSKGTVSTRVGPAVPTIDLVLQNEDVLWRIFGANSMVQMGQDVMCLGFLDGGVGTRASIVIGGYQLEDNLVQIDMEKKRVGFTSSLLFRRTTCANFNFTLSTKL